MTSRFLQARPKFGIMTIVTNQGKIWWIRKSERYDFNAMKNAMRKAKQKCGGNEDKLVEIFLGECYTYGVERGG